MAKALKIASIAVAFVALAVVTAGVSVGLTVAAASTATFAGLSVGTLLAASAALSAGASLLAPRPKAPAVSSATTSRLTVSMDTRAPRKIVFGRTAFGADLRDQESSNDQSYLHRFVVCASHKVQSFEEIWFDDKLAWTAAGGVQGEYVGYLTVTPILEGSAANAINIGPRMGSSRRYTGCAYVYFRYRLTGLDKKAESPFAQSIPSRATIVGKGMGIYDPRKDSTVGGDGPQRANDQTTWAWDDDASRNPALQLLAYLLGYRIKNPVTNQWKLAVGKGIPAARINIASFITAANLCDEPVSRYAGGFEPRYRSDGIFSEGDDLSLVLDNFKSTMNALIDDVDGRWRVLVLHNDLATPIEPGLSMDDVMGDFNWDQTPPLQQTINGIRGGCTDPSNTSLYQLIDYPEVVIPSPDGIDRIQTVNYALVQSPSQAQRLAKTRLQRSLYGGTFTATFQATAWRYQKGDVIRFTWPPLGWSNKLFRIADMAIQVDGLVPMMLREENAAIYAWDGSDAPPVVGAAPTTYNAALDPIRQQLANPVYDDGSPMENLKPGEAGADVTGNHTSADTAAVHGRSAQDVVEDLDVNAAAIISQALRQDDAQQVLDARTFVEGQPVSTKFLQLRQDVQTQTSAVNSSLQLLGAKTPDGTGFVLDLDTVQIDGGTTLSEKFEEIGADNGEVAASVQLVKQAVIDPDGNGLAKATLGLTVGKKVAGIIGTNDGLLSNVEILTNRFALVDPTDGTTTMTPFLVFGGTVYMTNVVVDKITYNSLVQNFNGINQQLNPGSGFQVLPGGFIIQWGQYRGTITNEQTLNVNFPLTFPNALMSVSATAYIDGNNSFKDMWLQTTSARSTSGAQFYCQAATSDNRSLDGFDWIAFGK